MKIYNLLFKWDLVWWLTSQLMSLNEPEPSHISQLTKRPSMSRTRWFTDPRAELVIIAPQYYRS
jgi:hypothetical protein